MPLVAFWTWDIYLRFKSILKTKSLDGFKIMLYCLDLCGSNSIYEQSIPKELVEFSGAICSSSTDLLNKQHSHEYIHIIIHTHTQHTQTHCVGINKYDCANPNHSRAHAKDLSSDNIFQLIYFKLFLKTEHTSPMAI